MATPAKSIQTARPPVPSVIVGSAPFQFAGGSSGSPRNLFALTAAIGAPIVERKLYTFMLFLM